MDCIATRIPYRQTNQFNKIVLDYIDRAESLKPFLSHPPTSQGVKKAIEARKKFKSNREVLVSELKNQYKDVKAGNIVKQNIDALLSDKTFTITTAHQPNIFTGPLYFIYKILHVIKLSEHCKTLFPEYNFVPVYCMGSEDADLDELGHIYFGGEKLEWKTDQSGAVGRMKVDKELLKLIGKIEGQVGIHEFGKETIQLLKNSYKENEMIQDATFHFINTLFSEFGLVVLIPDNADLKKHMIPVFEDDILHKTASGIVEKTAEKLKEAGYKTQVNPREINLFYLKNNIRERVVKQHTTFKIQNSDFKFTEDEIKKELQEHPENFSPNVVLRGLYQSSILPDIIFIGGGGEIAYWLQLKDLFDHYKIPFPVLVLRNSFLILEKKWKEKINRLGFNVEDIFLSENELLNKTVEKESMQDVKLNGTFSTTEKFYDAIKKQASAVDSTLAQHVDALKAQTLHRLYELEKKMLRAGKRKFTDQQRQIHTIKVNLFPGSELQERYDNLLYYYSIWGKDIISKLYEHSLNLEQEFVIIQEK